MVISSTSPKLLSHRVLERERSRTNVALATTVFGVCGTLAVVDFMRGVPLVASFELVAALIAGIALLANPEGQLLRTIGLSAPLLVWALFLIGFLTQDSLGSAAVWMFLVPPATTFLFGSRWGALVNLPFLALLSYWLWHPSSLSVELLPVEYRTRFFVVFVILVLLSALFEASRETARMELDQALAQVQQLEGMLPICAECKNVRDDAGYWEQVESYLGKRTDLVLTRGLCPQCHGSTRETGETSRSRPD